MCVGRQHPGLPSLQTLHIENDVLLLCYIWDMLALCPSLDQLHIVTEQCADDLLHVDSLAPPASISIRHLTVLAEGHRAFERAIALPNVTTSRWPTTSPTASSSTR